MKLVRCSNREIIISVTSASEIHAMITVALEMSKHPGNGVSLCTEGVSYNRKGVPGFSVYIYNSMDKDAGKWAKVDYMAAKKALRG